MEKIELDGLQSFRLKGIGMMRTQLRWADHKSGDRVGRPGDVGPAQKGVPYFCMTLCKEIIHGSSLMLIEFL